MARRPRHGEVSNVSDDTIAEWRRQYALQKRACEEANSALRDILKKAKAEGINNKALIASYLDGKLEPEVVAAEIGDRIRYNKLAGMQLDIDLAFDAEMSPEQARAVALFNAEQEGYDAAKLGAPVDDNKYAPGSEEHVAWAKGWRKSTDARKGKTVQPASTARKRPGRPAAGTGRKRGNGKPRDQQLPF